MAQDVPCNVDNYSEDQEMTCFHVFFKVDYNVLLSPQIDPVLIQSNSAHIFKPYFSKIRLNIILNLCLNVPRGLFSEVSGPIFCTQFSFIPFELHVPTISSSLIKYPL